MAAAVEHARLTDWRPRLHAYFAEVRRQPFRPGRLDCALFAAGAVQAMTGEDVARTFRGYRSLRAGRRALQAAGFPDHVALAASLFVGAPVAFAQEGDLAVIPLGADDDALGVVGGARVFVMRRHGIGTVPLGDARLALKV